MKSSEFLKTINELDDELILGTNNREAARPLHKLPWFWVAAVLMLAVSAFFVTRACIERGRLREVPADEGANLTFKLAPIAFSSFKGEIRDAGRLISEQIINYKLHMSSIPHCYTESFASLEETEAYLGNDALKDFHFPYHVESVSVGANGGYALYSETNESEVYGIEIHIYSKYDLLNLETGFIYAQEDIRILTDVRKRFGDSFLYGFYPYGFNIDEPYTYSYSFEESDAESEDLIINRTYYTYKVQNGETARIAYSSFGDEPYDSATCYALNGGILYELHLTFYKDDANKAMAELCRWADSFK
ncbi:MAG: hypothetical protein IKZ82_08910 [Clostridia bacterium]|nr:hypothetical protein [Clostridia bacterium]